MASLSNPLTLRFQREINRISDADRNTRKSGLKKLLENLPWSSSEEADALRETCREVIFERVLATLVDQVEKCREYSVALMAKMVHLFDKDMAFDAVSRLASVLCSRVNDTPFPEKSEELRFQVVQLIRALCPLICQADVPASEVARMFEVIVPAIGKALVDLFPDVKKACSEVIIEIGKLTSTDAIRVHYKVLLKGLTANSSHQHYKVRSLSVKALSTVLCVLARDVTRENDLLTALQQQVLPLLQKLVADRSTSPRRATVLLLGGLVASRVESGAWLDPRSAAARHMLAVAPGASFSAAAKDESAHLSVAQKSLLPPAPPESSHESVEMDSEVSSHQAAAIDTVLLSTLVVMLSDLDDSVRSAGVKHLKKISACWSKQHNASDTLPFVRAFAPFILHNISGSITTSWTVESKTRQINALTALIVAVRDLCEYTHETEEQDMQSEGCGEEKMDSDVDTTDESSGVRERQRVTSELLTSRLLPQILDALATTARDDTIEIRDATESCCMAIGHTVATAASCVSSDAGGNETAYTDGIKAIIDYLVPRVQGVLNGLDTAFHRTAALTLLTYIIQGIGSVKSSPLTEKTDLFIADLCLREISPSIADPCLFEFREVPLRESALLLTRLLHKLSPPFTKACQQNPQYQRHLFQSLVYLSGRCAHEDSAIPRAAKREVAQMATAMQAGNPYISAEEAVLNTLATHFEAIVATITAASNTNGGDVKQKPSVNSKPCVAWTPDSAHRAAFEALVRECPRSAWQHHSTVIFDVIIPLVQPPAALVKGTPEEIAATYAAQRGDLSYDGSSADGSVDTRLSMLALLETLLRTGSSDWECSAHISACCDVLVEKALIPNLVWRAGRVEGVARKVTLTATYGLLKAGAISPQSLYKHAPHLVPLLASEMEDHDASSRHLGCLCLSIVFERLKGGFGEQAVLDLYPRLLKRLDDSDDEIRTAVCETFKAFLLCAPQEVYRGTMITYTLDQLFIHLDDSDPKIQKSVFDVLVHVAEHIDAGLVLKKAKANIQSHRTPVMCETVIRAVNKLTNVK